MPTYRLDISYDGSGFRGYARQPTVRTVQGDLEEALFRHTGEVDTTVAGRTDAGVHATGQVVSFSVDRELDVDHLMRSLNRQLGGEIAIRRVVQVGEAFSARFSATGRRYHYRIWNDAAANPLLRTSTWHVDASLDVAAMQRGALHLIGEHDFASFCRKAEGRSTVRLLREIEWHDGERPLLVLDIEASSFCHQMVRSVVAVLTDVGRGRIEADSVAEILAARDRHAGRGVAPPHGLTLVDVTYVVDSSLNA